MENELIDCDGWNKDYFQSLLDAQDTLDGLCYEIRNCRRQSSLEEIKSQIQDAMDDLENMKSSLEDAKEPEDKEEKEDN